MNSEIINILSKFIQFEFQKNHNLENDSNCLENLCK